MSAPTEFVHLHNHTEFSLLDGASRIKAMVGRAAELGMPALALTDHGVMYGAINFYKECKLAGIKPIVGCEVYVAPRSRHSREGRADRDPYHLTVLARNAEGYRNLMRLVTAGQTEGLYYKPRVDRELLQECSAGLTVLSGCLGGEVATRVTQDDLEGAREAVATYRDIFGGDNYLLEVQRHGVDGQEKLNQALVGFSKEFGLRLVATNDLHYVHQHDAQAHDVLLCLQTGARYDDPSRWRFDSQDFYLKTAEEMARVFEDMPQALASTLEVAGAVDLKIELGHTLLPPFETPAGLSAEQYLRQLVDKGLEWRFGRELPPGARARADEELSVIAQTGYATYFLIVWDFYNFARGQKIPVGPGRGSAAGSLVAFALGITDIDPLQHGLIFERFLNKERVSMPDIDCDFSVEGRERVIRYVSERYGGDRVAQIITFTTMASKAAIRDVGRVLDVPLKEADALAKLVPIHQGRSKSLDDALKEVPEFREKYETDIVSTPDGRRASIRQLVDVARSLEGVSRNVSVHAAGVVIAPEPLVRFAPLQFGPRSSAGPDGEGRQVITQYDMKAVGEIGLLKMDFLGLQNLDIMRACLRLLKDTQGIEVDLDKVGLEDPRTYAMLSAADTHGVFQFEGAGMRRLLQDMKPQRFEDIVAAVALFRPGPMQFIPSYIARKSGREKIEYLHPLLESVLADTYGVLIYQEQVMNLARVLAGYTLSEADILRAAMGKKDKAKMAQQKDKFLAGCAANGISAATADEIFGVVAKFAEYAFNKAHSAAYAVLAYRTAYLKANHPLEYMCALLRYMSGNSDDVAATIVDAKARGIEVLAPDVNRSGADFEIEGPGRIRFGLSAVKNAGAKAVELLVAERRENGEFRSLQDLCDRSGGIQEVNRRVLESLIRCGACDSIGERNQMLASLDDALRVADQARRDRESGQTSLFDLGGDAPPINYRAPEVPPMPDEERLRAEKELLGLYLSDHPLNRIANEMASLADTRASEVNGELAGSEVRVGGMMRDIRRVVTRSGQIMAFATLEDLTGAVDVVLFARVYEQYRKLFEGDKPVIVQGRVETRTPGGRAAQAAPVVDTEDAEPAVDEPAEQASILAEFVWHWDDPECVPVDRRHTLHVDMPAEEGVIEQLTTLFARHPGEDPVYLHFSVGDRTVTVQAGDRYHVTAGPGLADEVNALVGAPAARLVAVRPKASPQTNGNGYRNGRGRNGDGSRNGSDGH